AIGGLNASASIQPSPLAGPITGKLVSLSVSDGYTIETTLDPHDQPFLHDLRLPLHVRPELPGRRSAELIDRRRCQWHSLAPPRARRDHGLRLTGSNREVAGI